MKSIHLKLPEGFLERLETQRQKDRLSPDRSEFIRRLLDLQLSRLEAADVREKNKRQSQLIDHLLDVNRSVTQSANSSTEQLSRSTTDVQGN
jgi:Arc/MetJ-type ribon-helix-helix transcriptional regulator